jgi:MipA family protein
VRLSLITLITLLSATPAYAQETPETKAADSLTIGIGGASVPRFEGAADNVLIPAGAIRGSLSGITFSTAGTALYVDLIAAHDGPETKFVFGPVAHMTLNRTSNKRTRDPQIIALGKLDTAIELGGHIGVQRTGVITSVYDVLSLDLAITHDVTGTHGSMITTPSISYSTPLSKTLYVGASIAADHVGSGYARTYFGVSPAQSLASTLPIYGATKGWKDINVGLLTNISLSGDLRRGLSLFALGNYERLLGDFARSPIVRTRNQWFGGVGLAYTF